MKIILKYLSIFIIIINLSAYSYELSGLSGRNEQLFYTGILSDKFPDTMELNEIKPGRGTALRDAAKGIAETTFVVPGNPPGLPEHPVTLDIPPR